MQELQKKFAELKHRFEKFAASQNLEDKQHKIGELDSASSEPQFWNNQDKAKTVMRELSLLKEEVELYTVLEKMLDETREFIQLQDESLTSEIAAQLTTIEDDINKLEMTRLFQGKYDLNDALLSVHAGTGGVDAQDWAQMLERMYLLSWRKHPVKKPVSKAL
jgi:peptide chain release factor 2